MTQKVIKYKKREKKLRKQLKLYKFVFQKYERNVRRHYKILKKMKQLIIMQGGNGKWKWIL